MPSQRIAGASAAVATLRLCIPALVVTFIATSVYPADTVPVLPLMKSKFNKLRHITLKDDAFCEAYQELRDGNCVAKLADCSPLDDDQVLKMRQILCGPKFNVEIQPPPHFHEPPSPPELNSTEPFIEHFPPPYYLDVHPSKPNSFPWLAAIYSPDRKFICTGALVAPKTVVTAAQCVAGQAPPPAGAAGGGGGEAEAPAGEQQAGGNFFVRFGRHHLNISHSYDKAFEYDVESVDIVQQFDRAHLENDFAILKLVSPVCNIPPVGLPKKDDWENGAFLGTKTPVVYAGWGLGRFQKPYLRSLTSHLVPKHMCAKKFNWPYDQMSSNHLCVSPPINVCVGGIGTPLVAYTPHRSILLGVMSLGDHCNTDKLPLLFTKVSTYIDDIDRFVEEDFKAMAQVNATSGLLQECFQPKPYHTIEQPYFYYPSHYPTHKGVNEPHFAVHAGSPLGPIGHLGPIGPVGPIPHIIGHGHLSHGAHGGHVGHVGHVGHHHEDKVVLPYKA